VGAPDAAAREERPVEVHREHPELGGHCVVDLVQIDVLAL
jgi:hypothetical protein